MNVSETKSEVLNAHYVPCNSRLIDYSNITIRRRGNFRTKRTLEHCCPSLCHLASILDAESNDVDRYRVLNVVSNNASVVEGQCGRWTGGHAHQDSGTAVLSRPSLESTTRHPPTPRYVQRPATLTLLSFLLHTYSRYIYRQNIVLHSLCTLINHQVLI